MSANPRASMTVTSPPVTLVPGRAEIVTVSVVNQGMQPDDFRLGVRGIEPGWVTFRPPSLSLGPGEQGTIEVLVQPLPTAALGATVPVLRLSARSSGTTIAEAPLTTSMTGQAVTMHNMMTPAIGGAAAGTKAGAARSGVLRWLLPLLLVGALACVGVVAAGGVLYVRGTASQPTATLRVVRPTATIPVAVGGRRVRVWRRARRPRPRRSRRPLRRRYPGRPSPARRCPATVPPPRPRRRLRPSRHRRRRQPPLPRHWPRSNRSRR